MPTVDMDALTKGEIRKLNALKRSVGNDLGEEVFLKWLLQRPSKESKPKIDPVAERIAGALEPLASDPRIKTGLHGYTVKRSRRLGGLEPAAPFVVFKNGKRATPA